MNAHFNTFWATLSARRRHQIETFSVLLALREGNPLSWGESTGLQWRAALMFSLICAWTNGWANNRDAGDSRRHCAHYDVTVVEHLTQFVLFCEFQFDIYFASKNDQTPVDIVFCFNRIWLFHIKQYAEFVWSFRLLTERGVSSFWWKFHHCQNDNSQCSQWWKFHQNDDIFVLVTIFVANGCSNYCRLWPPFHGDEIFP